jgi:hypothetical protein
MRRYRQKESKKQTIIVIFIAFIMVTSIIGFIFVSSPSGGKLKFNKFTFVKKGNLWSTSVNKKEALFNYYPAEVVDINLDPLIKEKVMNTLEVDSTYSFNNTFVGSVELALFQLETDLNFHFGKFLRKGLIINNSFNLPIITCNDSTEIIPVLYFKESNETKIYLEENCIIAEAKNGIDFLRIKDRLMYGLLGIIG